MELNRVEALAQFNKLNGMFTMVLQRVDLSLLNNDLYHYVEIEIDTDQEKVVGTYDDFSIVNINDEPMLIMEDQLNLMAREKIIAKYPLEKQLSIIGSLLETLAVNAGINCDDLKEMNDFIEEVRYANGIRKDFYANNNEFNYVSTEAFEETLAKKYEGGILENGVQIQ
jgi:hypothetical protein